MKLSPPVLSWEINEIFKKDILKELQWAAASVLVLLLSLDNTVTGYEQSLTVNEHSIQIYQLLYISKKLIHVT